MGGAKKPTVFHPFSARLASRWKYRLGDWAPSAFKDVCSASKQTNWMYETGRGRIGLRVVVPYLARRRRPSHAGLFHARDFALTFHLGELISVPSCELLIPASFAR